MSSLSRVEYPGLTGATGSFVIPFPFFDESEIEAFLDGALVDAEHYNIIGSSIEFLSGYYPEGSLILRRTTDISQPVARFSNNSPIRAADLNASMDQAFFAIQEVVDGFRGLGISFTPGGELVLPSSVVGLGQVDNTGDLEKPVSTAVQNALAEKLDASEFNTNAIFNTVVAASGGIGGNLNAYTISGKTLDYLLDFRNVTNKPSAYPPTPHTHSAADITVGQFPPNVIPAQGVTQHQSSLLINYSQLRGLPPGSLGEVADGKTYLRTQGEWVEFDPALQSATVTNQLAGKASISGQVFTGDVTAPKLFANGPRWPWSGAALQVNGSQRTGAIYLHEGSPPRDNNKSLRNHLGKLIWDGDEIFHEGNFDPASKANVSHTHVIADVTGLQDALDNAGGGLKVAAIQTSPFTPAVGNAYPVQGGVTLSGLPASPVQGDRFELHDPNRSWSVGASVTIPGRINGRSENQIVTVAGARVIFEYVDAAWGWEMKVLEPKAQFAYSAPFVNTPSITAPANGATEISETPTLTSDAFGTTNQADTHALSDWQIASDSGFTSVVIQSLDDASNKTSWTVPGGNLSVSTTYYARVRHGGASLGDSEWSEPISFTTAAIFRGAETQALIGEMAVTPSFARQQLIDDFIEGLKSDGIWSKLDRLWVLAAHDAQASRLDWKNPAASGNALTAVNSPTFTADQGYTGDASSAYLNTQFSPSGDAVQASRDNASFGVWVRVIASSGTRIYIGATGASNSGNTNIYRQASAAVWAGAISGGRGTGATASSAADGFLALNRTSSSAAQSYRNGALDVSDTGTSSNALPLPVLYLLGRNNNGALDFPADGQLSFAFYGASLTATEHANLYSRLNTYMAGL